MGEATGRSHPILSGLLKSNCNASNRSRTLSLSSTETITRCLAVAERPRDASFFLGYTSYVGTLYDSNLDYEVRHYDLFIAACTVSSVLVCTAPLSRLP